MSGIFGSSSGAAQAQQSPAVSGLSVQTSSYGTVLPIVFGQNRIAPNLMGYWNFVATPHAEATSGGGSGKGGVFGGGNAGSSNITYTYSAAVAFSLCEGPITGYGTLYVDKQITTTATLGFSEFLGTYPQTAWTYLTTSFPADAYGYNGVAYLAASAYDLGSNSSLPNHNVVVKGLNFNSSFRVDADPSLVINGLLTNAKWGVPGFSTWLGSLTTFQDYCFAAGIALSPIYETQQAASQMIDDLGVLTNSEPLYTAAGGFRMIPRGDEAITANGHTYTPPVVIYNLTDDDFLPDGDDGAPIEITRSRPSDQINSVRLEVLDDTKAYQKVIVEAKDQAAIDLYGLRQKASVEAHSVTSIPIGQISAQLLLQRQTVRNIYRFKTDIRFMLLDPMDLLTLTHSGLGIDQIGVRIRKITKTGNELQFECEEYLAASGTAAAYAMQGGNGFAANYDVAPGNITALAIWEPQYDFGQGMEINIAACGNITVWGGCDIYASYDNVNFTLVTAMNGPSRMGSLTANIAGVAGPYPVQDNANQLKVDMSISGAQLNTVSLADELAGNALCFIPFGGGEYLSYRTVALTGPNAYTITNMLRGMYGTTAGAHNTTFPFIRVDGRVARFPYDQTRIGATIFLKFLSWNIYGRAQQTLASVSSFSYTITGLLNGLTTVSGFAVVATSIVSDNGGFIPGILCTWTALPNQSATAVLIQLYTGTGSTLLSEEYCNDPNGGRYTISQGLQPNTSYFVRATLVTAPTLLPTTFTAFLPVTTGSELVTLPSSGTPGVPSSLSGVAAIRNVFLQWVNPTIAGGQLDPNLSHVEVYAATVNNRASAVLAGYSKSSAFVHSGLAPNTTYYYWIRSITTGGIASAFHPTSSTAGVAVTTALVNTPDVIAGAIISDRIAAGQILASHMTADSITIGNAAIEDLTVETFKIAGSAVTAPAVSVDNSGVAVGSASYQLLLSVSSTVTLEPGYQYFAVVQGFAAFSRTVPAFIQGQLYINGGLAQYAGTDSLAPLAWTYAFPQTGDGSPQTVTADLYVVANASSIYVITSSLLSIQVMKR